MLLLKLQKKYVLYIFTKKYSSLQKMWQILAVPRNYDLCRGKARMEIAAVSAYVNDYNRMSNMQMQANANKCAI